MNCIAVVTDEDFGLERKELYNPIVRFGARGIVLREDGKMAVFCKEKINEYKLPGGGIEKDETPAEAFKREVLEEVGCEVEILEELGFTEERKGKTNFMQTSYIFVGKVVKDLGHIDVTEKEKAEGAKLIWVYPQEALDLIAGSLTQLKTSSFDKFENPYTTGFMVVRDKRILQYYLKKNN